MKMKKKTGPVKGRARASLRLRLQKSLEATRKSRVQRQRAVTIPRTVEMVDQKSEGWRSEKSQLMFMTAMGLTPKADWKGMVPASLNVDEHFLSQRSPSTGNTETNSEAEVDDDCICLGVFNFTPVEGYRNINACTYYDSYSEVLTENSVDKISVSKEKVETVRSEFNFAPGLLN